MIEYFSICATKAKEFIFGDNFLSPMEIIYKLIDKVNELIDYMNEMINGLAAKEDSINITGSRKLSEQGDFTGTWWGNPFSYFINWLTNNTNMINSNQDEINFLVNQFEDGATGLVIECGYFTDMGIDKNYDGGVW